MATIPQAHEPAKCPECGSAIATFLGERLCVWCSAPADSFRTPCDAEMAHGLRSARCADCESAHASEGSR